MKNEEEIFDETKELVMALTKDGVKYFKMAIDQSGLKWSNSLYNSMEGIVFNETVGLGMEIQFTFEEYWRYKDMRKLEYSTIPNIDAMKKFVDAIKPNQIPWINGYKGSTQTVISKIGEAKAKERLLWSILSERKKAPTVKHENKRRLYNKTKSAFINVLRRKLMQNLGRRIPTFIAENMGRE